MFPDTDIVSAHLATDVECTNHILYGLKHSRLRNTFHTVIFGMSNSLLALATDSRRLL
jgi:hypothetical protein